ncbi:MAG: DUF3536 domain-containing protein [Zestosphaera sp.]
MRRYVVIHAHFYQPSRENPWLSRVTQEASARPYHDWNEKVMEECYRPNALIPIVDKDGYVVDAVNNYSWLSFDVGPTLLTWLRENALDVYEAVVEADHVSRGRFSGHGSAIAQVYNHMIMPLAKRELKYLATYWGVEAFREAFGRSPEGMWLPETAVDDETLDVLAELSIKFTILAPHQASMVRTRSGEWADVSGGRINVRMPYLYRTSSGRAITLFFYDARLSHGVAFGDLLCNGDTLAESIAKAFSEEGKRELVVIATDGETYGHHKRHGHLALAYALRTLTEQGIARVTNFSEFLELSPPEHEVRIFEGSSWSCSHGVERWRNDCGCRVDTSRAWSQEWRKHLREAIDWLNSVLVSIYFNKGSELFKDPWRALLNYVSVAGKPERLLVEYLKDVCKTSLSDNAKVESLKLLEMMRHALLMQSSDGWFFDDISNIETVQIMKHAARAMELAKEFTGIDLENTFLTYLRKARSNVPELVNGENIYRELVKNASIDHYDICILHAVLSLVGLPLGKDGRRIFGYTVSDLMSLPITSGMFDAVLGKAVVTSSTTLEPIECAYYAHMADDHTILGASGPSRRVNLGSLNHEVLEHVKVQDSKGLRGVLSIHFTKVEDVLMIDLLAGMKNVSHRTRLLNYITELLTLQTSKELSELLNTMLHDPIRLYGVLSLSKEMRVKMSDILSRLDEKLSEQLISLARKQFNLSDLTRIALSILIVKELAKDLEGLRGLWRTRASLCVLIKERGTEVRSMCREGIEGMCVGMRMLEDLGSILNLRCG